MNLPLKAKVLEALEANPWDLGNKILYKMCSDSPEHDTASKIINKMLIIGRVYAASVERRKNKTENELNENFYIDQLVPKIQGSQLDIKLKDLKSEIIGTQNQIMASLSTHFYLASIIEEITEQKKRSFSSKYLHFHMPDYFYIYDSRAKKAINYLVDNESVKNEANTLGIIDIDTDYALFYVKMKYLQMKLKIEYQLDLSPRQLDTLLLKIADGKI